MEVDVIQYGGYNFSRYPDSNKRSEKVYYSAHTRLPGEKKMKKRRLHVFKYLMEVGPIPNGFHVHHKDGNPLNNQIDNYECKSPKAHVSDHWNNSTDEFKDKIKDILLTKAIPASKAWHASEEGRKWHSEHAKSIIANKTINKTCLNCGAGFITGQAIKKHCSNECKVQYGNSLKKDRIKNA